MPKEWILNGGYDQIKLLVLSGTSDFINFNYIELRHEKIMFFLRCSRWQVEPFLRKL